MSYYDRLRLAQWIAAGWLSAAVMGFRLYQVKRDRTGGNER